VGLNEKRKLKELQDVTFAERTKELLEITGSPIKYEVDWASLADDLEGMNFVDNLSCHRTNMALRVICADALGKDAVKDGLKTIKLKNVKNKGDMKIAFSGGVLEMCCAYALRTDGMFSDNEIKKVLEAGL
jgi:hypothetical protein